MKQKSIVTLCLALMLSVGCSTVTISPKGAPKTSVEPTYSDSKSFFLWGLVGEHDIDVKEVCGEREVKQMQTQRTFTDSLLTIVTIGIYAPRTAKVWCEKTDKAGKWRKRS